MKFDSMTYLYMHLIETLQMVNKNKEIKRILSLLDGISIKPGSIKKSQIGNRFGGQIDCINMIATTSNNNINISNIQVNKYSVLIQFDFVNKNTMVELMVNVSENSGYIDKNTNIIIPDICIKAICLDNENKGIYYYHACGGGEETTYFDADVIKSLSSDFGYDTHDKLLNLIHGKDDPLSFNGIDYSITKLGYVSDKKTYSESVSNTHDIIANILQSWTYEDFFEEFNKKLSGKPKQV